MTPTETITDSDTESPGTALLQLADSDHYRRFICAILLQAVIDAKQSDTEAREWIRGDYARELADRVDLGDHFPRCDEHLADSGRLARNRIGTSERIPDDLHGTMHAINQAWRKHWARRCGIRPIIARN